MTMWTDRHTSLPIYTHLQEWDLHHHDPMLNAGHTGNERKKKGKEKKEKERKKEEN